MAIALTLYTRHGCHLCDVLAANVRQLEQEFALVLESVDIETNPELVALYGEQIPVLFINGRKAFKYRATVAELRQRLAREPSP